MSPVTPDPRMTSAQDVRISGHSVKPILESDGLRKSFGGALALDGVTVRLRAGRITALVGENGAGKSTLIGCLTGSLSPDAGGVVVDGDRMPGLSPRQARDAGIAAIRQEPVLVPTLSVTENLVLGDRAVRRTFVSRRAERREALRRLDLVGGGIDPDATLADLSPADRQLVEVARAIGGGARVLFFDEPTASLSPLETRRLFGLIRRLRDGGAAIAYVSHRLEEILELADDVVVLRDGVLVDEGPIEDFDEHRLVTAMAGREVAAAAVRDARATQTPVLLELDGVAQGPLADASLVVHDGEVVGLAGIVGSSRTRLLSVIAGAIGGFRGRMTLAGTPYAPRTPRHALARGVAFVTEDRHTLGLFSQLSAAENVLFGRRLPGALSRAGIVTPHTRLRYARTDLDRLGVVPADPRLEGGSFSGGNQQKLMLGRALGRDPRLLLLDEPTRGVDVRAKREIHRLVRAQAAAGCGVLVASSDVRELIELCDRIVVMARGRTTAEFVPPFDSVAIVHAAVSDADADPTQTGHAS